VDLFTECLGTESQARYLVNMKCVGINLPRVSEREGKHLNQNILNKYISTWLDTCQ